MSGRTNVADMGALQRTLESMLERMERCEAQAVKLQGQLSAVCGRVLALENPEPALNRAARGLAELSDKIDRANPDRVPGNSVAALNRQKR